MTSESKLNGKRPHYNAYTSGPTDNAPNLKIGAAWNVAKGGISLSLVALPVDGRLVLFPVKEDE